MNRRGLHAWGAVVTCILLAANGCAPQQPEGGAPPATELPGEAREAAREILPPLQHPASFGRRISLVQVLEGRFKDQTWEMLTQIEIDETRLAVAALSPLGVRLFSLVWEGGEIEYTPGKLSAPPFEPRAMLADIQAALWPAFPAGAGWHFREERIPCCTRIFTRQEGEPVVTVAYETEPAWEEKVVITRPQLGYTVVVTTLSWESLDE